jgi:hypothetical protein
VINVSQLIRKVRSGQQVQEAVEDIISRGVSELRKNAFGDDNEDSKTLPWSREQAWLVLKQLSKQEEVRYYSIGYDSHDDDLLLCRYHITNYS